MKDRTCIKCGSELFLDHYDEIFCPNCEGIKLLSKEESLVICAELIQDLDSYINLCCSFFSSNYLLQLCCRHREFDILESFGHYKKHKMDRMIASTILIAKVLKLPWQGHNSANYELFIKPLSRNIKAHVYLKYVQLMVYGEYGLFHQFSKECKFIKPNSYFISKRNNKKYAFFVNKNWESYRDTLEYYNISNKDRFEFIAKKDALKKAINEAFLQRQKRKYVQKEKERSVYKTLEQIYVSFNYIYPDPETFSFKEINNEDEVLAFLRKIHLIAQSRLPKDDEITIINKSEFFQVADMFSYDSEELYDMLVSSYNSVKKFPIIVEINNELILCPKTIFLVIAFLTYKFNEEIKNNLLTGDEFEAVTENKLIELGFTVQDPKNPRIFLRGRKVKIEGKSERQIDLIAYNKKTIWVIECKDHSPWKLEPKILWERSRKKREKGIKKEIKKKHLDRLNFVKQNYKSHFGFEKDYEIKGLLVTRIKERIKEYKGVYIISLNELEEVLL